METRITKIQKGEFYIEFRKGKNSKWETFPKKFKTQTKAQDFLVTNKQKFQ